MSSMVIFIPNNEKEQECGNIELLKLTHPSSGLLSYFCIKNKELFELKQLSNENERSWFIENTVKEEGSFYCMSPFDPLFIILDIFEKMDEKKNFFQHLDIILYNDKIPGYSYLINIKNIEEKLNNICDINALNIQEKEILFKFNEDKAINWLTKKIENLCNKFENFELCMHLLKKYENSSEDLDIKKKRITLILISEYLSVKWSLKLKESLKLPEPLVNKVNYVYADEEELIYNNNNKRINDNEISKETKKKKVTLTPGQQRLAKANKSGMKSLEFFFKKK